MSVKSPYEGDWWQQSLTIDYDEYRKNISRDEFRKQHETSFRGSRHNVDPVTYEVINRMDYIVKRLDMLDERMRALTEVVLDEAELIESNPTLLDMFKQLQATKKLVK